MSFSSVEFLLFFVVLFFIYYYLLKEKTKAQNFFLLVASYFFYGYADLKMLPLLFVGTLTFYGLGLGIFYFKQKLQPQKSSSLTVFGIVLGIGLLLYFKYLNFFILSFSEMIDSIGLKANLQTLNILLPVGISFITFRLISYVMEVHRGTMEPTRNFVTFATFVAFFPSLLSGPIDRPQRFIPQLEKKRPFNEEMAVEGLRQMLWGLFKKMVVADTLAGLVNGFWGSYSSQLGSTLFLTALLYAFQIYADFSGYSDMAIGVSKVLGFNVAKNFDYPYFSRSISEFWRKWHMSLTSWLTDYVYIPLGGNRCSKSRTFFHTMIVFSLCGLWHGANWTFLVWGMYNGLLFIPQIWRKKKKYLNVVADGRLFPSFSEWLSILCTFFMVLMGWILFRSETVIDAWQYIKRMFSLSFFTPPSIGRLQLMGLMEGLAAIVLMLVFEWLNRRNDFGLQICGTNRVLRWVIYLLLAMACILFFKIDQIFIFSFKPIL